MAGSPGRIGPDCSCNSIQAPDVTQDGTAQDSLGKIDALRASRINLAEVRPREIRSAPDRLIDFLNAVDDRRLHAGVCEIASGHGVEMRLVSGFHIDLMTRTGI